MRDAQGTQLTQSTSFRGSCRAEAYNRSIWCWNRVPKSLNWNSRSHVLPREKNACGPFFHPPSHRVRVVAMRERSWKRCWTTLWQRKTSCSSSVRMGLRMMGVRLTGMERRVAWIRKHPRIPTIGRDPSSNAGSEGLADFCGRALPRNFQMGGSAKATTEAARHCAEGKFSPIFVPGTAQKLALQFLDFR